MMPFGGDIFAGRKDLQFGKCMVQSRETLQIGEEMRWFILPETFTERYFVLRKL